MFKSLIVYMLFQPQRLSFAPDEDDALEVWDE